MKKNSKELKILSSYRNCIRQGINPDMQSESCYISENNLKNLQMEHKIAYDTFVQCSKSLIEINVDKLSFMFIEPTGILLHISNYSASPISAGFSFLKCGTTAVSFSLQDGIAFVTQPEENFPIFFNKHTLASIPISIANKQYIIGVIYKGNIQQSILLLILQLFKREMEKELFSQCSCINQNKETFLTNRQKEVLFLLSVGLSDQEISNRIYISLDTVHYHKKQIYKKLNARNAAEAVTKGFLLGEITILDVANYQFR